MGKAEFGTKNADYGLHVRVSDRSAEFIPLQPPPPHSWSRSQAPGTTHVEAE